VDQGSHPDQIAAIEDRWHGDPKLVLRNLPSNLGVPGGRNLGASLGSGRVIVFLDNDAVFASSDSCARALEIMDADPGLGALAFHILNAHTGTTDRTAWNHAQDPSSFAGRPFLTTRFSGGGCAVRRDAFEACSGFDPRLEFMEEEKDLGYRFISQGYRILHTPDVEILHWSSPEARVDWGDKRLFYLCRNMSYLELKHRSPLPRKVSAFRNLLRIARRKGSLLRGVRGLLSGLALGLRCARRPGWATPLTNEAWRYIDDNESRHYGRHSAED
jgi:GT2 family glycosyltransferase